jgi:hypothetical protein
VDAPGHLPPATTATMHDERDWDCNFKISRRRAQDGFVTNINIRKTFVLGAKAGGAGSLAPARHAAAWIRRQRKFKVFFKLSFPRPKAKALRALANAAFQLLISVSQKC